MFQWLEIRIYGPSILTESQKISLASEIVLHRIVCQDSKICRLNVWFHQSFLKQGKFTKFNSVIYFNCHV